MEIKTIVAEAVMSVPNFANAENAQKVEDAVFSRREFCPHFGEFATVEDAEIIAGILTFYKEMYEAGFLRNKPAFLV